MLPTSLPGGIPAGMVAARPTSPRAASRARFGIAAASSGVRPPSSATGSSDAPSGTHTTYFIRRPPERQSQTEFGADGAVVGVDRRRHRDLGDGTVGVLQAVAGHHAHHPGALGHAQI